MPVEADEAPLEDALARAGVAYEWAVWDDPEVQWSRFAGVLIRTVWDYTDKIEAFRDWVRAVAAETRLWNPGPVVAWNSHKRYLLELAERGVPVTPTTLVPSGTAVAGHEILESFDDPAGFIVKPAESVGSLGLTRWDGDETGRAGVIDAVGELHRTGQDALVQPLLTGVMTTGETSMIFLDGTLSHAVVKVPANGDIRSQPEWGADVAAWVPTAAQRALGTAALAAAGAVLGHDVSDFAYARVDTVDTGGALGVDPVLMELELIEPDLYLAYDDGAADRVVAAITGRLTG